MLGALVGKAGSDEMAALVDISKGISGSHADTIALVGGTLIDGTGKEAVPDSTVLNSERAHCRRGAGARR